MANNFFIKLLASLPVILIFLYYIPFLGICLILLRYFISNNSKRISTPIIIIGVGIMIVIPKIVDFIFKLVKFDVTKIPYFNDIMNSSLYNIEFIKYSKFLICVGVIFLIISFVLKTLFKRISNKLNSGIMSYINETQKRDYEIAKQNDMEIKLKQERAKHTSFVRCSYCGADNVLTDKIGTCKYCRRKMVNKNYKA